MALQLHQLPLVHQDTVSAVQCMVGRCGQHKHWWVNLIPTPPPCTRMHAITRRSQYWQEWRSNE